MRHNVILMSRLLLKLPGLKHKRGTHDRWLNPALIFNAQLPLNLCYPNFAIKYNAGKWYRENLPHDTLISVYEICGTFVCMCVRERENEREIWTLQYFSKKKRTGRRVAAQVKSVPWLNTACTVACCHHDKPVSGNKSSSADMHTYIPSLTHLRTGFLTNSHAYITNTLWCPSLKCVIAEIALWLSDCRAAFVWKPYAFW